MEFVAGSIRLKKVRIFLFCIDFCEKNEIKKAYRGTEQLANDSRHLYYIQSRISFNTS